VSQQRNAGRKVGRVRLGFQAQAVTLTGPLFRQQIARRPSRRMRHESPGHRQTLFHSPGIGSDFFSMIVPPVSISFSALFGKTNIAFPAPFDNKITGNHEGSMKSVVFYIFFTFSSFIPCIIAIPDIVDWLIR
jgi:hypothetical protein